MTQVKSLLIATLALVVAYQKADPKDQARIEELDKEAENLRNQLANEKGEIAVFNDAQFTNHLQAVLENAKAQAPDTATAGTVSDGPIVKLDQPEGGPAGGDGDDLTDKDEDALIEVAIDENVDIDGKNTPDEIREAIRAARKDKSKE